ncbi:MAG: phosphatase PAP2 family protein [Bryobacteraceae bacterium]
MRTSEKLLSVYFLYTAVLAQVVPVSVSMRIGIVALNAVLIAGFFALARAEPGSHVISYVRDWYPMPQMLLAYKQMGWFAQPHMDFRLERAWVEWDRLLLHGWGLQAAVESLGPVLPSILEISYMLVYAIASSGMAVLYLTRRRGRVDDFQTTFLLGILMAYALFPLFPSEPPRTVFPTDDLPSYLTVFRRFNLWLVGSYGIHTSVFPSAHVSGAFAGAFAMMRVIREPKWIGRAYLGLAVLIAISTVYGRYHYAVDAVAGLAVATGAEWCARRLAGPPGRGVGTCEEIGQTAC